jgi:hypothetical protein
MEKVSPAQSVLERKARLLPGAMDGGFLLDTPASSSGDARLKYHLCTRNLSHEVEKYLRI